ncbi:MAG TPA: glycosyltransferase family 2 protein [Chitinophagales bacterium]|nr:glycosyltransferase family 2 protein [Chitinophagales bacterium]
MQPVSLSIVLPCYNPVAGWADNVVDSFNRIKQQIPNCELILVNDGSPNIDTNLLQSIGSKTSDLTVLSYNINQGKGYALRHGVSAARGELIIYTDIDFPYTHHSFLKIYESLTGQQADVAMGIRGEAYYTHLPQARVRISKLLRWFIKTFLRIPTDDTQCGLKGFNQKGKAVFLETTINRYLFDMEFIFIAARKKLNIKTVEVELRPEVELSTMNSKILIQEFGNFLKIFVKSLF